MYQRSEESLAVSGPIRVDILSMLSEYLLIGRIQKCIPTGAIRVNIMVRQRSLQSAANRKGVAFRSNHSVGVQLHKMTRLGYDLEHEHVFGSGKLLKDPMHCLPGFLSESAPVRHDWVCAKH